MDVARRQELYKEIESAKRDEDSAWAAAADMRRKKAPATDLIGAIHLVEATTAKRMRLEEELRQGSK